MVRIREIVEKYIRPTCISIVMRGVYGGIKAYRGRQRLVL